MWWLHRLKKCSLQETPGTTPSQPFCLENVIVTTRHPIIHALHDQTFVRKSNMRKESHVPQAHGLRQILELDLYHANAVFPGRG